MKAGVRLNSAISAFLFQSPGQDTLVPNPEIRAILVYSQHYRVTGFELAIICPAHLGCLLNDAFTTISRFSEVGLRFCRALTKLQNTLDIPETMGPESSFLKGHLQGA